MEGQQISVVVTSNAPAPASLSDSESSIHQYPVNNEVSCLMKPGVVSQRSGGWGAYLCANGEHIWLGSYETKEEAASVAQKSASMEFCDVNLNTPQFQSHSTTDEFISLTMDSSYGTMFPNFWRAQVQEKPDLAALCDTLGFNLRRLFTKVLTPSDVGKLNRIVIPKRFAIKHFPRISEDEGGDVEVMFFDMSMKMWKFRYCYWGSSQSYVFTKGWNDFLKEKCLKPNDTVIFSAYERTDGLDEVGKQYVIDVSYDNNSGDHLVRDVTNKGQGFSSEIMLALPAVGGHRNEENRRMDAQHGPKEQGVKLFGVKLI